QREITAKLQDRAENDRTREVFVGALGHDLRNPLSAILINAEIVRRSALGDRLAEPLDRIVGSANRMARMISDLLDFTRVRQGTLWLDRQPADVRQITAKVIDELQTIHPGRIHADLSPVLVPVDPDRFAQVVSNLVANAVRHGDGEAVRVRLRQESDGLVLEVHNTGSPIPAEAREGMFDPFRRSSAREGLGLGLFIVRHIVGAHGGDVQVRSDAESGTTFRVGIPAGRDELRPSP
nr:HAMP domain-containing histidine kinase [Acidobacteriota bacterium]